MPVRYICRHCGFILWEFKHVGQDCYGLPSPSEIITFYGGICPKCKKELSKPSLNDISISVKGLQQHVSAKHALSQALHGGSQQVPVSTLETKSSYTVEVS